MKNSRLIKIFDKKADELGIFYLELLYGNPEYYETLTEQYTFNINILAMEYAWKIVNNVIK